MQSKRAYNENGTNISVEDKHVHEINYGAHRVGIRSDEMVEYYSNWAKKGTYEKDLCPGRYNGPLIAARYLSNYLGKDRATLRVIDVAAGTGLLGVELLAAGCKLIDGVEPSESMIAQAKEKHIYQKLYRDIISEEQTQIQDDVYDGLAVSGGMGEGHIPTIGLCEMARITKPGGFVVIVMREEYLTSVLEYRNRLQAFMKDLEEEGVWDMLEAIVVPNYSFNKNGMVFVFKVKVNGCPKVALKY